MSDQLDVIIIGAGPSGYVTAIRAAQLGMKTAVVEENHLGGICLNWGCIPTKALLRSAEIYHYMKNAANYGLKAEGVSFDLAQVVKRSRQVSAQLNKGVGHLLKKNKVKIYDNRGVLVGKDKNGHWRVALSKDDQSAGEISAPHVIIATGARARVIPGMEPDGKRIWTYREALVPQEIPKSLAIIGSGAIGIEFASFFKTFGSEVTVIEVMDRILPVEDAEISALAAKQFEKQGMKILTKAKVNKVTTSTNDVALVVEQNGKSSTIKADIVISAVGIVGNVENLGLEATKVEVDRTHIKVDGFGQTAEKGLYAIGDVAGPPWLAHKAEHEGVVCIEKIANQANVHPFKTDNIPGCTYSHPQIASVGLTEAAAKEKGYKIKVGRFPFMANGKAIALGEPDGLIKTIFDDKTGELLGAHMIGAEVTELIQGYVIARTLETTEAELMHNIFPHPTLSEMMHESVLDAYGQVIHF